ncbi:MAG: hypothetical protein IJY44_00415 [Bacteroidaceae bacterium]|nr:hypothetical protein [Bacteroidaceae bacterium]
MKKNYTAPLMTEVNVEAENMLAASIIKSENTLTTNQAWSNENRGSWGDLWSK